MDNIITIKNCNNINIAEINIVQNNLNILFAPNGTGKSTIARAIFLKANGKDLSSLHSYGEEENPSLVSTEELKNVFVFDEDFVNTIVFQRSEVIEKSFEIFIKTPSYNERLENVNNRLRTLKIDIGENEELKSFLGILSEISNKITLNSDGSIRNTPFFKSIVSKDHLYRIPENLEKYKPFFETDYNIDWVDWKNKGFSFDEKGSCPFCAAKLLPDYQQEKKTFTETYNKNNVKHLKDILEYFSLLKEYLTPEKFHLLNKCIKTPTEEDEIKTVIIQFIADINYIKNSIEEIISFDSYKVKSDEITALDNKLSGMKINLEILNMIKNEKMQVLINDINSKIGSVLSEVIYLKKEIGELKGITQKLAVNAQKDINNFLESAGINYELSIDFVSESDSRTVLKYIDRQNNHFDVGEIKDHLSWGERNAFALVLFMHYALSKKPDLIILDDPISSFDRDKKYAIINRLFINNNPNRSFYNETVLMMTHDLEPIIDFIINKQPTGSHVTAKHLQNKNGKIIETQISNEDIKSQIDLLMSIIINTKINEVSRLISLRKYIDLTKSSESSKEKDCAYNIISSALHLKEKPIKRIGFDKYVDLTEEEIELGENYIKSWFSKFSYNSIIKNELSLDSLIKYYKDETCNHFKIQIFRIINKYDVFKNLEDDIVLLNFINQTYHIENDYLYTLDILKFEMIPEFIINKCNEYILTLEKDL